MVAHLEREHAEERRNPDPSADEDEPSEGREPVRGESAEGAKDFHGRSRTERRQPLGEIADHADGYRRSRSTGDDEIENGCSSFWCPARQWIRRNTNVPGSYHRCAVTPAA